MRHQVAGYRLSRGKDERTALRRTLIRQLFTHERITTTRTKAAAIRGDAEKLITLARNSAKLTDIQKVNARRLAAALWAMHPKLCANCLMILVRVSPNVTVAIPVPSSLVHALVMPLKWSSLNWLKNNSCFGRVTLSDQGSA